MLVLKRKIGEAILITSKSGEQIEVKVSEISEGRVKLGIDADRSISVLRKEVVEQTKDENKESSQANKVDKETLKTIMAKNK